MFKDVQHKMLTSVEELNKKLAEVKADKNDIAHDLRERNKEVDKLKTQLDAMQEELNFTKNKADTLENADKSTEERCKDLQIEADHYQKK